jgi:hypothetical protein
MEAQLRAIFAILVPCCLAAGCFVESRGHYDPGSLAPAPSLCTTSGGYGSTVPVNPGPNPPTAAPGERAGVFVEYASGGHWHVQMICDSLLPSSGGQACTYDIWAQVIGGTVANLAGEGLGPNDLVGTVGSDTARLSVDTSTEVDGMRFDAPPGATVRLSMLLGNEACVGFIFYRSGVPAMVDDVGNPVDLVPTTP